MGLISLNLEDSELLCFIFHELRQDCIFHGEQPPTVPGWHLVFGYLIVIFPLISDERESLLGFLVLNTKVI